jgi:hypothetical protein
VLLHGHCHGRATGGFEHEQRILEEAAGTVDVPDTGCCGMAGAWGYESAHYDVSRACAERALLPAVHDAAPQTPIVASGLSCRSQITQLRPGRRALHVGQLLGQGAVDGDVSAPEAKADGGPIRGGEFLMLLLVLLALLTIIAFGIGSQSTDCSSSPWCWR